MSLRPGLIVAAACIAGLLVAAPATGQDREQQLEVEHVQSVEPTKAELAMQAIAPAAVLLPPGYYAEQISPGNSFSGPVGVAFAPDGRIFVVEKRGRVYVVDDGTKLATPFIDLQSEVMSHWDRGLLGFAFDPDFEQNGHVYLLYTYDHDGAGDVSREDVPSRVTRYTVDGSDPNVADLSTRQVLIGEDFASAIPSCYWSHAIGTLQFSTDGSLLISAGDGASFNHEVDEGGLYPDCFGPGRFPDSEDIGAFRSQYLGSMAGKILRVDPATGLGLPSNPFYTGDGADNQSRVWAYGLRNPFRFTLRQNGSTDPADGDPGTLFIGDVGFYTWEDLHVSDTGGENFGWPCYEGPNQDAEYQAANPDHSDCSGVSSQDAPPYYWHHSDSLQSIPADDKANAIVVGDIYEGFTLPVELRNRVFYSDYQRGWIASSVVDSSGALSDHEIFATGAGRPVDIRYDRVSDYIYYVDYQGNNVWRIRHNDENAPPTAVASADPLDGYAPLDVQFTGNLSSDPDGDPLSFDWDFGDGNGSTEVDPEHTFTSSGLYVVSLTVEDDNGAMHQAFLQVAVDNTFPESSIIFPENGASFAVGETVDLVAGVTDAEDPPSAIAYEWVVGQQHNSHVHSDVFVSSDSSTSFVAVEHGLTHEAGFVHVQLVVTDSGGLTDTTEHVIEVRRRGEHDITDDGTPVALVTSPSGSGNPDISVIADSVFPAIGTTDPLLHYDTDDGSPKSEDWIGYTFAEDRFISKLVLQQGVQSAGGGWFEDVQVEARVDGSWQNVEYQAFLRPYESDNGIHFDQYTVLFEGLWADGVRLVGTPGGTDDFVSVGELRVYEAAAVDFSASPDGGSGPLEVTFADRSTVADVLTWAWDFGDGHTSAAMNPVHTYDAPGAYDVSLTITNADGEFVGSKADFVVVGENGLLGQYFNDFDFQGNRLVRIDPVVDFDWGSGSPDPSMGANSFTVRWTGFVRPEFSEQYTFHTTVDDGVRLWIGGELIIDQWIDQSPTEHTGTKQLTAGTYYPITMEFYENGGGAVAELAWSSASRSLQIIPQSRLIATSLAPRIASFDPGTADFHETVHIYGENLASVETVSFDGTPAVTFGVVSDAHIWANVPDGAETGLISVTTPEGAASSVNEFVVDDNALAIGLQGFVARFAGDGVRVEWRVIEGSDASAFAIEHARPGDPEFVEIARVTAERGRTAYSYQTNLSEPGRHRFRLAVVGSSGDLSYSQASEVDVEAGAEVVVEPPYPNPFDAFATLRFYVRRTQHVDVAVYDMIGRRLMILHSGEVMANDPVTLRVERTSIMASGLYLIRIEGEHFVTDRKLLRVGRGD